MSIRKVQALEDNEGLEWLDENQEELQRNIEKEESSDDEFSPMEENAGSDASSYDPIDSKEKETTSTSRGRKNVYISTPVSFTCAMCKVTFATFLKLSVHMRDRNCGPADQFSCDVCKKVCPNKRALSKHKQAHKPKHRLMCEGCGKEFNSQFDLDFHTEVVHGRIVNEGITYRCSHCPDTFSAHAALMAHVKKHKDEKNDSPRLCEICAKECPNLKSYRAHISNHKNKNFVCDVSLLWTVACTISNLFLCFQTDLHEIFPEIVSASSTLACSYWHKGIQVQRLQSSFCKTGILEISQEERTREMNDSKLKFSNKLR